MTGNQNGGPVTIPTTTTSSPQKTSWIKIPNKPRTPRPTLPVPSTTKLQWLKITYPHRPTPVWQHVGGKGNSSGKQVCNTFEMIHYLNVSTLIGNPL